MNYKFTPGGFAIVEIECYHPAEGSTYKRGIIELDDFHFDAKDAASSIVEDIPYYHTFVVTFTTTYSKIRTCEFSKYDLPHDITLEAVLLDD